jgi:peptidoglycan hydrolase-like protein with peptidoglycan-binding domain
MGALVLLTLGALVLMGASTKSTPQPNRFPPLPDGDFDYLQEDEGDLVLEEDGLTYEGSGYEGVPIAQMKAVQHYLALLEYYAGEIHGRYTDATEDAIAEFQGFVNFPQTGEPTQETLVALADVALDIQEQYDTQADEITDPDNEKPLSNLFVYQGAVLSLDDSIHSILGVGKGSYIEVWDTSTTLEDKVSRVLPVAEANPDIQFFVYQGEEAPIGDASSVWADSITTIRGYTQTSWSTLGSAVLNGPTKTDTAFWAEFDEDLAGTVHDIHLYG